MSYPKGSFAGEDNYFDWHGRNREPVPCAYCRKPYTPTSPTNRHCEWCLPAYRHDQWRDSLSKNGFIRRCLGMSVAEYIADYGQAEYDALE